MTHFYRILVISLLSLLMASCSYDDMSEKLIPKQESEFAKEYLSKLRSHDFEYVKRMLNAELAPQANDAKLKEMVAHFRAGEPISVTIIGSQINVLNDQWQGNFTFEYEFESGWNLANVALRKTADGYEVIALNVYQTEASQKELNAFNLSSKSPLHYFILFFAVASPIFILVTLVICVKTPIPRRKWLWIIFVLLGVGAIKINWTSGIYAIQVLSIHLLGVSAISSGPFAPWVLTASLPLGAIIFWFKRKTFVLQAVEANKSTQLTAHASAD